jgi:uncharacterized membrane protein YdbT with pleckstrin-like domain
MRYINTPEGLYEWARGAWIDLTAILLLIILPLIAWRHRTYELTDEGFVLCRGIILRRQTHVPRRHISTLSVERPFFLRPLRAVRIAIDTDAGDRYRSDFSITVGTRSAHEILEQCQPHTRKPLCRFQPRWYHVVMLSLLASNFLSGILLLATALHQSGRLLGEHYKQNIIGEIENVAEYITVIPRTATLVAFVLLGGWGIAALRSLLRYLPFHVTRNRESLTIRTGLLTPRHHLCSVSSINYVDYRRTILSMLLRIQMVFIHCIGYGKGRDALAVLIPAVPTKSTDRHIRQLLPEFRRQDILIRPAKFSLFRYVLLPFWSILLLYPISRIIQDVFPQWQDLIYHLTFMAYIPCLWLLTVKIIERYSAGLSLKNGFYTLKYSRLLTFHTIVTPIDKVVCICTRQTPFQHFTHTCDILLYTYNEAHQHHRIKHVRLKDAHTLLDKNKSNHQGEK